MDEHLNKVFISLLSDKVPEEILNLHLNWNTVLNQNKDKDKNYNLLTSLVNSESENIYNYLLLDKVNQQNLNKENLALIIKFAYPQIFRLKSTPKKQLFCVNFIQNLDKNLLNNILAKNNNPLLSYSDFNQNSLNYQNLLTIFDNFKINNQLPIGEIIKIYYPIAYTKDAHHHFISPRHHPTPYLNSEYFQLLDFIDQQKTALDNHGVELLIYDLQNIINTDCYTSYENKNKTKAIEKLADIINFYLKEKPDFPLYLKLFNCHFETFNQISKYLPLDYSNNFNDDFAYSLIDHNLKNFAQALNIYNQDLDKKSFDLLIKYLNENKGTMLLTVENLKVLDFYINQHPTTTSINLLDYFNLDKIYNGNKDKFTAFYAQALIPAFNQTSFLNLSPIAQKLFNSLPEEAIEISFRKAIETILISSKNINNYNYENEKKKLNIIKEQIIINHNLNKQYLNKKNLKI